MSYPKVPPTILVGDVAAQTRAGNARRAVSVEVCVDAAVADFSGRKGSNCPAEAMADHNDLEGGMALSSAHQSIHHAGASFSPRIPKTLMGAAARADIDVHLAGIEVGKPVACRTRSTESKNGETARAIHSDIPGHVGGLGAGFGVNVNGVLRNMNRVGIVRRREESDIYVLLKLIDSKYIGLFHQGAIPGITGHLEAASNIVVICGAISRSTELCKKIQISQEALIDC